MASQNNELTERLADAANELGADISKLRKDAKSFTHDASKAASKVSRAAISRIQEEAEAAVEKGSDYVRAHPFATLAAGIGVGAVLGVLLGRRH